MEYLRLTDPPALVAHECRACGARYLDRRIACANCGGGQFATAVLPREGHVRTFSIVCVAPPGVETPYVPVVVDCGGTLVPGRLVNVEPDAARITVGMAVRLTTYVVGVDREGTEAVNYAFEPVPAATTEEAGRDT